MELLDQISAYQALMERKQQLQDALKQTGESIVRQRDALAALMIESEVPKISYNGFSYSVASKTRYSKKAADDADDGLFFERLREAGLSDLIRESVNANTLQGAVSSLVEERGELPGGLEDVLNVYEYVDVVRRKDTTAALKR